MTIDPRLLRHLRAIVECGTYREAAERLHVTQPMLSKSVQQLEHRLGAKVLTRGRHGAIPTVFGDRLVAWSKIIDSDLSKALQDIDDIKGTRTGHVRTGAVPPLAAGLIPQVVYRMKAKHPGILISFKEDYNRALTDALLVGDLDLVVGAVGLEPVAPNTEEELLFSAPIMVFVGRRHPLASRHSVSLKDLHRHPWASPVRSSLAAADLLALVGAARLERFETGIETDSFPTIRLLLQDGNHFALHTAEVFADDVRQGRLVALHLKEREAVWRFGLKRRRDAFETPAMRAFAEHLRHVVAELTRRSASKINN
nr:LysR family transcriptional regulator [Nitrosomonas nitrosa]